MQLSLKEVPVGNQIYAIFIDWSPTVNPNLGTLPKQDTPLISRADFVTKDIISVQMNLYNKYTL